MNTFERKVKLYLENLGDEVLRNGYPDFMIRRLGRYNGLGCVEVKNRNDKLRPEQVKMIDALKKAGLPTYIIRPQDFEKGESSHDLTPTGKPKHIGRLKKVISAKDYNNLANEVRSLRSHLDSRSEYWFNSILTRIDNELKTIFDALDEIKKAEKFLDTHGIIIEVDEPKVYLNEPKEKANATIKKT